MRCEVSDVLETVKMKWCYKVAMQRQIMIINITFSFFSAS